jgi:hypothetical protein
LGQAFNLLSKHVRPALLVEEFIAAASAGAGDDHGTWLSQNGAGCSPHTRKAAVRACGEKNVPRLSIGRCPAHLQGESSNLATTYPTGFTLNQIGEHHAIHAHF